MSCFVMSFQTQLASVMDILVKAAISEVTKIVEGSLAGLQAEIDDRKKENESLKLKLLVKETEWRTERAYGSIGGAHVAGRRSVAVQVHDGEMRTGGGELAAEEGFLGEDWTCSLWKSGDVAKRESRGHFALDRAELDRTELDRTELDRTELDRTELDCIVIKEEVCAPTANGVSGVKGAEASQAAVEGGVAGRGSQTQCSALQWGLGGGACAGSEVMCEPQESRLQQEDPALGAELGTELDFVVGGAWQCLRKTNHFRTSDSVQDIMAPVVAEQAQFAELPVAVGVVSVFGLVFSVSLFSWICCQRKNAKSAKTPPYRFVHMLKGVDIYPEGLSGKRKFGASEAKGDAHHAKATPSPTGTRPALHLDLNGNFSKPAHPAPKPQDREGGLGRLFFSLEYNLEKKAFVVHIQEAQGLCATDDQSLTSDPYIKLTILPEKKHKVKTRVLRKTLDPAFQETFSFYGIPFARLPQLALHFMVLSFDRFSRDEVIGETLVPLSGIDLSEGRVRMHRDIIKRNQKRSTGRGELLLSLCYQSTTSTLTVVVLKARHLPKTESSGPSDPYVKLNLYQGAKRVCKKKTHVKKCSRTRCLTSCLCSTCRGRRACGRPAWSCSCWTPRPRPPAPPRSWGASCWPPRPRHPGEHWREICDHPRRQIAKWHALSED
ncbi:hypothetical protein COCON_G00113840 [Conger conger]|uniref:C2 domain-containing protein n=1 Tax=Conger conger TaxID=82655 RepID=A0A9Q1DFE9_CONCO|nr:hypothetical protein COCON_G00113840 [Conger conger]